MLTNLPNYQVNSIKVLTQLAESKLDFHLTGSRYFGNATQLSDWDFFCQDSKQVRNFLVSLGFKVGGQGTDYLDNQMAFVYRHPEALVDVQVVHEVLVKQIAQLLVDTKEIHRDKDLTTRNSAWNIAYKRARTIIQLVKQSSMWAAALVHGFDSHTDDVPSPDVDSTIPKRSRYTWTDREQH